MAPKSSRVLGLATLLACAGATPVSAATPKDGQWLGTDALGKPVSFVVNGNGTRVYGSYVVSCGGQGAGFDAEVTEGAFRFSRYLGFSCYELWQMSGTFASATSATGTHFYRKAGDAILPCVGCSQEVAWTATFVGPITGADLSVTKTDGQTQVLVGAETTYEVRITNLGPATVSAIAVVDNPPFIETVPSWSASSGTFDSSAGVWTGPPLATGQFLIMRVSGHVPATPGPITNIVTVSPIGLQDPRTTDNSAGDTTYVRDDCDLVLRTVGSTALLTPPSHLVLTTIVTNQGVATAREATLSLSTPPGLEFVGNSGACTTPFPCALGTMPPGDADAQTVVSSFMIPAGYSGPEPIVHAFAATSTTPEQDPSNNNAWWTTDVRHPGPPSRFFVLEPCRLLDTRRSVPLAPLVERPVQALLTCGIPPSARALAVNVTVTEATGEGHLNLFGTGHEGRTSTLNFRSGETRANNSVVEIGEMGQLSVRAYFGAGTAHAIIDVSGYFE